MTARHFSTVARDAHLPAVAIAFFSLIPVFERSALADTPPVMRGAIYANHAEEITYGDGQNPLKCPCREGRLCAWGDKTNDRKVAIRVGDHLVATEPVAATPASAAEVEEQICTGGLSSRWFVSVPTDDISVGSVITAEYNDGEKVVLKEGSTPHKSAFTVDANLAYRSGSTNGSGGTGVGFATTTRGVIPPSAASGPLEVNTSRWSFGLRYDVDLFSQDWLHRLAIIADVDIVHDATWCFTLGVDLGGALSAQTSGGSALSAGLLAGGNVHVDYKIGQQMAFVVGVTAQGIVANAGTIGLFTGYVGPRVGF